MVEVEMRQVTADAVHTVALVRSDTHGDAVACIKWASQGRIDGTEALDVLAWDAVRRVLFDATVDVLREPRHA